VTLQQPTQDEVWRSHVLHEHRACDCGMCRSYRNGGLGWDEPKPAPVAAPDRPDLYLTPSTPIAQRIDRPTPVTETVVTFPWGRQNPMPAAPAPNTPATFPFPIIP
jgi:hypothetical protein